MLAEIKSGLDSAKASIQIVKAIKGVHDQAILDTSLAEIRDHIANLQEKLLETQQAADSILEERRKAVKELEDEREKNSNLQDYELREVRKGLYLYFFKSAQSTDTPGHAACPNCIASKTVSILQQPHPDVAEIKCHKCGFSYDPRTEDELREIYDQSARDIIGMQSNGIVDF